MRQLAGIFFCSLLSVAAAFAAGPHNWASASGYWTNSAAWSTALLPKGDEQAFIPNGGTAILNAVAPVNSTPGVTNWLSDLYFSPTSYGKVRVVSGGTLYSKMLNISTGGNTGANEGRLVVDGGEVVLGDGRKWVDNVDARKNRAALDVLNGGLLSFGLNHLMVHNGTLTVSNATLNGGSWIELGSGGKTGTLEVCGSDLTLTGGLTLGRYTGGETVSGIGPGNGDATAGLVTMRSGSMTLGPTNSTIAIYLGWKTPTVGTGTTLGRFSLLGGNVAAPARQVLIGVQNRTRGEFLISGGGLTASSVLVGRDAGARGILNLTGGALLTDSLTQGQGAAEISLGGGTLTVSNVFSLGTQAGTTGVLTMTGGALSSRSVLQGAGVADVRLAGGRITPFADVRKMFWGAEASLTNASGSPTGGNVTFDAATDQLTILVTNRLSGGLGLTKAGAGNLLFRDRARLDAAGEITVSNGAVYLLNEVPITNTSFRVLAGGTLSLEGGALSKLTVAVEAGGRLVMQPTLFAAPVSGLLSNASFELPSVTTYLDTPAGTGWAFTASGVQRNGSTAEAVKHYTWSGDQTAFLRAGASLSQTFTVAEPGDYLVAVMTAKQPANAALPVTLKIDGAAVRTWTPAGNFVYVYSAAFALAALDGQGAPLPHTIRFESGAGDATKFSVIDDVRVFRKGGPAGVLDMILAVASGATVEVTGGAVIDVAKVYVNGVEERGHFGASHSSQIFTGDGVLRSVLPGTLILVN